MAADCGADALERLVTNAFDLVIFDMPTFDLAMQDFSSIGVLTKLRGKDSQVFFLLATDTQTIETALEAMKNGAYDYVVKPFLMDDLRIKIDRALMERRLKDSLDRAYCILLVLAVSVPLLFMLSIVLGLVWAM